MSLSTTERVGSTLIANSATPLPLERTTELATRIFRSANRSAGPLSQAERNGLTTDLLFVLAITDKLQLTQHDKDRLSALHLAQLAVTEKCELTPRDKARLPTEVLFNLFAEGFVELEVTEMARFTAEQLRYLDELEAACAE